MAEPKFQPGDIVEVTIRGRFERVDDVGLADVLAGNWRARGHLRNEQVVVQRVTPAEGEPEPGDLWRDGKGELYFARKERGVGVVLVDTDIIASGKHYHQWREVHERYGLSLVYRDGTEGGAS